MWVMVIWICMGAVCTSVDTGAYFEKQESCIKSLEDFKSGGRKSILSTTPLRDGACIKSDDLFGYE